MRRNAVDAIEVGALDICIWGADEEPRDDEDRADGPATGAAGRDLGALVTADGGIDRPDDSVPVFTASVASTGITPARSSARSCSTSCWARSSEGVSPPAWFCGCSGSANRELRVGRFSPGVTGRLAGGLSGGAGNLAPGG